MDTRIKLLDISVVIKNQESLRGTADENNINYSSMYGRCRAGVYVVERSRALTRAEEPECSCPGPETFFLGPVVTHCVQLDTSASFLDVTRCSSKMKMCLKIQIVVLDEFTSRGRATE